MEMSEYTEIAHDLFVPASDWQLIGFANRLTSVAHIVGRPFNDIFKVNLTLYVGYGEDEGGSLRFRYDKDSDGEVMTLLHLRSLPINKTWSPEAAKLLLGSNFPDINSIDLNEDVFDGLEADDDEDVTIVSVYDQDKDDPLGFPEGYLEHETRIDINRSRNMIDAKKSVHFNIIDMDFEEVGADIVHARGAEIPLIDATHQDVERLYRFGETTMDFEANEHILNIPTAADLIVGMHALIGSGIVSPHTRAYKGAPAYGEIARHLPNPYL